MTNVNWLDFMVAVMVVVLAPGPGSLYAAKTAGARGTRSGRMAVLGIMLGDICLIALSLFGVAAIFTTYPSFFRGVRMGGAGYLIFLGLRSVFTSSRADGEYSSGSLSPFWRALTITLFNPKAILFFMAFFPLFLKSVHGGIVVPYVAMTMVFMGVSALYLGMVILVAARVGFILQEKTLIRIILRQMSGYIFVGFGIKIAVASN